MKKYVLEINEESLGVLAKACEFYSRVRMGQFNEIPYHLLEWKDRDVCKRRDEAERLLLEARKQIYPELNGAGHSYGMRKFKDADLAFDIYQVARNHLGDDRLPFSYNELPILREAHGD